MNDWMQVKVLTTTAGADLVSEILLEAGSEGTMIEDRNDVFENQRPEGQWDIIDPAIADRIGEDVKVTSYYLIDENRNNVISSIASALGRLQALTPDVDLGKLEMQVQGFENEDWSESWKKSFKPIRLGEHIVICPGWLEYEKQPDDKVIEIDPGMAFGTGTHETTGMCAALIEKYVQPGQRVIDIGTGSGILAIVAAHMGAKEVLATDLDAVAVRVAAENAVLNGFGDKIDCRCGDLLDVVDVSGDVVIANIIADVILMLAKPVRERIVPNGVFICSGVALERREDVRRALLEANYELLDEPVKGEWAAFAARKR